MFPGERTIALDLCLRAMTFVYENQVICLSFWIMMIVESIEELTVLKLIQSLDRQQVRGYRLVTASTRNNKTGQ